MYSRSELSTFTLQKLASIYPQTLEQEQDLKEVFEQRASVSSYFTLTSLVDIRNGWQEEIIQKYVDIKRETMPAENPVSLNAEDESQLDAAVITKEKELELQAKLDKANAKRKGRKEPKEEVFPAKKEEVVVETPEEPVVEPTPEVTEPEKVEETVPEVVPEEIVEETPKKETKPRAKRTKKAK